MLKNTCGVESEAKNDEDAEGVYGNVLSYGNSGR